MVLQNKMNGDCTANKSEQFGLRYIQPDIVLSCSDW